MPTEAGAVVAHAHDHLVVVVAGLDVHPAQGGGSNPALASMALSSRFINTRWSCTRSPSTVPAARRRVATHELHAPAPGLARKDVEGVGDGGVDIHLAPLGLAPLQQAAQAPDHLVGAQVVGADVERGCSSYLRERRLRAREHHLGGVRVAEDRAQRLVDLVRDGRGEFAGHRQACGDARVRCRACQKLAAKLAQRAMLREEADQRGATTAATAARLAKMADMGPVLARAASSLNCTKGQLERLNEGVWPSRP